MCTYKTCRQAGTEEQSLEMLEQGVIIAPKEERDFTSFNNRRGVRQSSLFQGKHPTSSINQEDHNVVLIILGEKHMLFLSSWLTNAELHIQWGHKTIGVGLRCPQMRLLAAGRYSNQGGKRAKKKKRTKKQNKWKYPL